MKNEIEKVRQDIQKYFDENNRLEKERYELSEGGLYYFTSERYKQNDPKRNWVICKIEIYNIETTEKILEYFTDADDNDYCACWFKKNGDDYLILPEAFQGQSIVDIREKKLYSFYSSEEPFIWQLIYPSPGGNKIAVDGCYWGCPNELRVYDTNKITNLPYPMIYQEASFDVNCVFEHWEGNNMIVICKNKKDIMKIDIE